MKILSLSCTFPNPAEPRLGIFVQNRLLHMAAHAEVTVLAPVAVMSYFNLGQRDAHPVPIPRERSDGPLRILHPRWFYPPVIGFLNPFFLYAALLWRAVRIRSKFRFNIIDSHFGFPDGIAAYLLARTFGVPYTITLRGSEVDHARSALRRYWMAKALRGAARVIAVSERLAKFANELGADPSRIRTIPNGIDSTVMHPHDRITCRREFGIAPTVRMILSAGHLIELKGHHRIVRTLARINQVFPETQLLIAGGAGRGKSFESEIRREAREAGVESQVRLLGEVPSETMARLMSAADLCCLASSREGWPNVVQEAMGCGCPVVATDVGAVPQMIPSQKFGLIVKPDDSDALAKGLVQALQLNWDREAIAAWGRARSWEQVAKDVIREFELVLTGNGAPAKRPIGSQANARVN